MTPCHENAPFATRPHRIRSASPAVQPCRRFSLAAPVRTSSLPGRRERSLPVPLAGARGILRHAAEEEGVPPPNLPGVKVPKAQPVPVPTENERRRLLASYNPQAACVALVLAYQGSPHGRDPRARLAARGLPPWHHLVRVRGHQERQGADGADAPEGCRSCSGGCGRPPGARNPARVPQQPRPPLRQPTRGGRDSPLDRAHATACRRAGVKGFRVHDWRHDWAARMVMAGVDLNSLMQLGRWEAYGWRTYGWCNATWR